MYLVLWQLDLLEVQVCLILIVREQENEMPSESSR